MNKTIDDYSELVATAISARQASYSPYSKFAVGAALLTESGEVFIGCNVENASYGLCICAERTAICKAVSEGQQKFTAIAVAATPFATPSGACRQFIVEFGKQIDVICVDADQPSLVKMWTSGELIPESFEF